MKIILDMTACPDDHKIPPNNTSFDLLTIYHIIILKNYVGKVMRTYIILG